MTTVVDILKSKADFAIYTIGPAATVFDAVKLMAEKNIGALVARNVVLMARSPKDTALGDVMTTEVMIVHPHRSSEECMALMTEHRLRHLPVMDDGRLTGLVSIGDLVKDILSEQKFIIEQLEHYISGQRS